MSLKQMPNLIRALHKTRTHGWQFCGPYTPSEVLALVHFGAIHTQASTVDRCIHYKQIGYCNRGGTWFYWAPNARLEAFMEKWKLPRAKT